MYALYTHFPLIVILMTIVSRIATLLKEAGTFSCESGPEGKIEIFMSLN